MNRNLLYSGFEPGSPIPFLTTMTVTLSAPPHESMYICTYVCVYTFDQSWIQNEKLFLNAPKDLEFELYAQTAACQEPATSTYGPAKVELK